MIHSECKRQKSAAQDQKKKKWKECENSSFKKENRIKKKTIKAAQRVKG